MSEQGQESARRQGTRVFKKSSPNSKLTAYLSKRDFIDHLSHVDPIEGVVLIDESFVKNRRVFVHVLAAFRYGREDLDVLGLSFRKDLFLASAQIYPPQTTISDNTPVNPVPILTVASGTTSTKKSPSGAAGDTTAEHTDIEPKLQPKPLTRLQERLIKKLGPSAYPFYFELPHATPASVTLQPGPNDSGKPCGVDYELRAYIAEECDEKPQARSSVRMAIRKLTYAPEESAPQPSAEVVKDFIMSPGTLRLEVSLDKEKYYHGEFIAVNVLVDNNSNKTVKKVKVSVMQVADIMLFSRAVYKCTVDEAEYDEGLPILPSQTGWCKVYHMCPLLSNNREKRGLALDGKLKNEDTNLASSTIISDPHQKENLGMIVQYRVRVRLVLGFGASDVCVELPFTLTHPKPVLDEDESARQIRASAESDFRQDGSPPQPNSESEDSLDRNFISLSADERPKLVCAADLSNDDLIFEDFARLRLRGEDINPPSNPFAPAAAGGVDNTPTFTEPRVPLTADSNSAPSVLSTLLSPSS
uniref:Arrestin C-terminal-like domain-containing protein n=1 Tax=Schistocephalus solidus TaxID=70667 RepID=A0A0V0J5Z7_SCHSO